MTITSAYSTEAVPMLNIGSELNPIAAAAIDARAAALLHQHQCEIWHRTDRLFTGLLIFEWLAGIVVALLLSPKTWNGPVSSVHPHVWQAIFLGLSIIIAPVCFGLLRPGAAITRHLIAIAQMLSSALLIHLGNGRAELHFHVFGSLAFLAFYRDWKVLISATIVVAADHFLRGIFFPQSVFGLVAAGNWRWLEHAGWVVFEDLFLLTSCRQGVREMRGIAQRQALLEHSHQTVEEKVIQRTQQLKEVQQELVKTARSAGMAEIATSVLHNVGNVLNSVNISVTMAITKVQESPVPNLALVVNAFDQHKSDLGHYLTTDQQGQQIPGYLATVSEVMREEQTALLGEMASLAKHVDHIKQIVSMQQQHAKHSDQLETVTLDELLDDAIQVAVIMQSSRIEIVRDFAPLPRITTNKHAVLQIFINLLNNAKHALLKSERDDKRLIIRTTRAAADGRDEVRIQITDNGVGIDPANLVRIFTHGFTTKKEGHGFGLHSSANAAKQLRGSLTASSDGPGAGATFTLNLPLNQEVAPHV